MASETEKQELRAMLAKAMERLDELEGPEVLAMVQQLRGAGLVSEAYSLSGQWRQNRFRRRDLSRETGTTQSTSPLSSEPSGGSNSATS